MKESLGQPSALLHVENTTSGNLVSLLEQNAQLREENEILKGYKINADHALNLGILEAEALRARLEAAEARLKILDAQEVELPGLTGPDEDEFEAQRTIAAEYNTDWQGLADSCIHHSRAIDVLMDLASTECALKRRERQYLDALRANKAKDERIRELERQVEEAMKAVKRYQSIIYNAERVLNGDALKELE